jgi:hypothetical protein
MGVTCAKCRMVYRETELIWVEVGGKMELLCDNCARKRK